MHQSPKLVDIIRESRERNGLAGIDEVNLRVNAAISTYPNNGGAEAVRSQTVHVGDKELRCWQAHGDRIEAWRRANAVHRNKHGRLVAAQ